MGNRIRQRDDRRCWFDFSLFPGLMTKKCIITTNPYHVEFYGTYILEDEVYHHGSFISLRGVERWWWRWWWWWWWWWWACWRSSYGFVLQSGKCQFMACLSLRSIAGTLLTKTCCSTLVSVFALVCLCECVYVCPVPLCVTTFAGLWKRFSVECSLYVYQFIGIRFMCMG